MRLRQGRFAQFVAFPLNRLLTFLVYPMTNGLILLKTPLVKNQRVKLHLITFPHDYNIEK